MTRVVATSVVRGSHQGESHGGVYLVDFGAQTSLRVIDWNTMDIDWQGRGWDRGLRGIAFDGERVFIAASDELYEYTPDFRLVNSWRNPFLKHCHEIAVYRRRLYLTSTGFDSLLGFDLDNNRFSWGLQVARVGSRFQGSPFDPASGKGPPVGNELHINNVCCTDAGLYLSGLRTGCLLRFNGRELASWVTLPLGIHNAMPYRDGVIFNDTQADLVRFESPGGHAAFKVPQYEPGLLTHVAVDDSRIARQGFGRGLCVVGEGVLAAGSSPSTITLHAIDEQRSLASVALTMDIRNAIHGLEPWPFD